MILLCALVAAGAESASTDAPIDPNRTEVGLLPAINYDSDLGFGFGVLAAIARFEEGVEPYAWRIQVLLYATARDRGAGLEFPFHSDYVIFDVPAFLDRRLRLTGQAAFAQFSNSGYYGFGSRSQRTPLPDAPTETELRFHTYERTYPSAQANLRWQLIDRPVPVGKERLELFGGSRVAYNAFQIYPGSLLEQDILRAGGAGDDGETLRALLQGTSDHILWVLNVGLLLDTRDQEFVPTTGTFTELSARVSPGLDQDLAYVGFTLNSAWFAPLAGPALVAAGRLVFDGIFGDAPFYELTQFGALNPATGPGGSWSLRGVPIQRFAGKLKAIGNLELRAKLLHLSPFGQRVALGLIGFADIGRVWADLDGRSLGGQRLDGPLSQFALGLGGGLRVQWGETFVIRADYAVSPTEGTSGLYIDVGQVF